MNLDHIIAGLKVEVRKLSTTIRVGLLLALPYAAQIKQTISDQMPALQPYLPENIYKAMGGAVVAVGVVLSLVNSIRAAKASHDA